MTPAVTILFFGRTAELAGTRRTRYPLAPGDNVQKVAEWAIAAYPQLAGARLLYALNEQYTDHLAELRDGDELALFTPVSGG